MFAQQNLIPARMETTSSALAIRLSLSVNGIDEQRFRIVAEKIRMLVNVETVTIVD
ncbi:hypothetical protein [Sphingomonas lycopersici]|nr:hypothetical protein [Sphingomonas lycopersici]